MTPPVKRIIITSLAGMHGGFVAGSWWFLSRRRGGGLRSCASLFAFRNGLSEGAGGGAVKCAKTR